MVPAMFARLEWSFDGVRFEGKLNSISFRQIERRGSKKRYEARYIIFFI